MRDKVLSLLGLFRKSGKVVSGEFSCEKAVKEKKAYLVIVAEDASDNTRKLFSDKCRSYDVPCFIYGTKSSLGKALGVAERASAAVLDEGMAKAVISKLL